VYLLFGETLASHTVQLTPADSQKAEQTGGLTASHEIWARRSGHPPLPMTLKPKLTLSLLYLASLAAQGQHRRCPQGSMMTSSDSSSTMQRGQRSFSASGMCLKVSA